MRDAYHDELDAITEQLVEMTRLVGTAISSATDALLGADVSIAEDVIDGDVTVFNPLLDAVAGKFGHEAGQDLVQPLADDFIAQAQAQGLQAGTAVVGSGLAVVVIESLLGGEVGGHWRIAICNRKGFLT